MSTTPQGPKRRLPANPSQENLRKQAKSLAKTEGLRLAAAQRRLAGEYGHRTWADLMRAANASAGTADANAGPLALAAARVDAAEVRALLAQGEPANGHNDDIKTPLWCACASDAPADQRIAIVRLLLEAGASPLQQCEDRATPLHAAARSGPLELVETLIRGGAPTWISDRRGKTALDYARAGTAPDRETIVELLDRPVIRDPDFRAAVAAIRAGDVDGLGRLLDQHPELLHMRAIEPDCYPRDYFRDPKLFWFIANNPTVMQKVPANIVAITRLCLDAGADVNGLLPVHKHSTPLHQAAINEDLPMLELLVARGARLDTRDTLWNGTPLGWAVHNGKTAAEAYLRSLG